MSTHKKLVIDIETVGVDFDSLDEFSQEQLEKYFERYSESKEEAEEKKDKLGFWPLTGEVVAIGMLNPDTDKGAVYINSQGEKMPDELESGIKIETGNEAAILQKWWEAVRGYNYLVTFNGRAFDVPFLMVRSAIHGIRPSKNFLSNRYTSMQKFEAVHVDLADQLTFYGATRRNFSLHFWTKAFGIASPKEGGVTGDDVKDLYTKKKYLEIAQYNLRDLRATTELYNKWDNYLNI